MNSSGNNDHALSVMLLCRDFEEAGRIADFIVGERLALDRVEGADEAFERLAVCPPDLVIVCNESPYVNAFHVCSQLRHRMPQLQVITVVEQATVAELQASLTAGAAACLERPVSPEALLAALERCVAFMQQRQELPGTNPLADCDPRHALVQVDHSGRIMFRNGPARDLLHCRELEECDSFNLAVDRSLRDYRTFRCQELQHAVATGTPWRGELAGVGATAGKTYQCEVLISAVRHAGFCTVVFYDISELVNEREKLRWAACVAEDRLALVSNVTSTDSESPDDQIFNLAEVARAACVRNGLPALELHMPANAPEAYQGQAVLLEEILSGLAMYLQQLDSLTSLVLNIVPSQANGLWWRFSFELSAVTEAISLNTCQSLTEYLALLAGSDAGEQTAGRGLYLAAERAAAKGETIRVKCLAGEKIVFTFALPVTAADSATAPVGKPHSQPQAAGGCKLWTRHGSLKPSADLRILVAEDSYTDQLCIRSMLEAAGYDKVVVVNNGLEAVEEFDQGEYDLVFMDVLMPVMDGFEAVRLLRRLDDHAGNRTPVIALTSYSLKAVYEKCLSVGVDGYLSKPVNLQNLKAIFSLLMAGAEAGVTLDLEDLSAVPTDIFDAAGQLERFMGDMSLARTIMTGFMQDVPQQIALLTEYLQSGDVAGVERQAHTIKGAAANVGGEALRIVALDMEMLAADGDLQSAAAKVAELNQQFDTLCQAIDTFFAANA